MKVIYVIDLSKLDMPYESFEAHYCVEDKDGHLVPNKEAIDKYGIETLDSWGIDAPMLYRIK
jgi:hypothetical protein